MKEVAPGSGAGPFQACSAMTPDFSIRLFLHNPVTRLGDNAAIHIGRDQAHDVGHLGAEGMIAAERQYRHRELAVGRERFVGGGILREGRELIECRMRGAGSDRNL